MSKEQFLSDIHDMFNFDNMKLLPARLRFIQKTYWGWFCGCPIGAATLKHNGIDYSENKCVEFCSNYYGLSLPYLRGIMDGFDGGMKIEYDKPHYCSGYADGQELYKKYEPLMEYVANMYIRPQFTPEKKNESDS
jgi:hypothetical protein